MTHRENGALCWAAPRCCASPMELVAQGRAANFDIRFWRCLRCENHEHTRVRTDGRTFWVGAMARAIHREEVRIVAGAYGGVTPAD
jgi:hypothetical protein